MVIRSGAPPSALAPASPTPAPPPAAPPDRLPWVAPLWMAGVLIFYMRTATSWAAAQRLRQRGTISASADWQDRLRALARRLRVSRPVAMLESCLAETPAVVGFLRPAILIPAGLLTGLPPEQVEAILLHELAHIRRHDYAVNVLQTLVEGLLFYHPAVWWVSGVIRAERENCCDDAVVAAMGDAYGYAAALAELEGRRSVGQPALAARGGNLMRRIHRLLEP
jgi:beta-lactamase regulating signal transducer with metallopeptidase domain